MYGVKLFATVLAGGASVLGAGYAATAWSVDARLEAAARNISNAAHKQDRLPGAQAAKPYSDPRLARRVQLLPTGELTVTLTDAAGRVVYRSDPSLRETVMARGVTHPSGRPATPAEAGKR